jgi:hypothetical protein
VTIERLRGLRDSRFLRVLECRFAEHYADNIEVAAVCAAVPEIAKDAFPQLRREYPLQPAIEKSDQSYFVDQCEADSNR